MSAVRSLCLASTLVLGASGALAGGHGIAADADSVPWLRVQGRVAYSAAPAWGSSLALDDSAGLKVAGVAVLGDVYFGGTRTRSTAHRGFRATSGVLVGSRGALWGSRGASGEGLVVVDRRLVGMAQPSVHAAAETAEDAARIPYVGIGYSSLRSRSGWSFTADLGLVSRAPGNAVRFGRVVGGSENLDDVIRDMRLAPVMQLGVTYAF